MAPISRFMHSQPVTKHCILTFPAPEILIVTLNRPKTLNCINSEGHEELDKVWKWLDTEPSVRVGIITGQGRAFCAGADLKEWNASAKSAAAASSSGGARHELPTSGFGGLSRRSGAKPVIAAVNGICFGGGCEMIVNCDLVFAAHSAIFALPEVKHGVVATAGVLPRLIRTIGRARAMEMALTGRVVTAEEAERWGLINRVTDDVVDAALGYAKTIAQNSPDAVIVTREGLKMGWQGIGAEEGSRLLLEQWYPRLVAGENFREGLRAFVEKRSPRWKASKL